MEKFTFPVRINKYVAQLKETTRRGADDLIKQKRVYLNGRLAVLGDKVNDGDQVDVRFRVSS
jgi:23S rRNA pseudouridine2604 synthase